MIHKRSSSIAATCDYKFFKIAKDGSHGDDNLKSCFNIGWKAGFRGPWAFHRALFVFFANSQARAVGRLRPLRGLVGISLEFAQQVLRSGL